MPVIINGSTGISGTDGSAATPAVQGSDTNTGIFFPAADTIAFSEGGVEAMRIDSSGNVSATGTLTAGNISTSGTIVPSSSFLRNRIINGDMRIDQRNNGASVTPANGVTTYTVDRWAFFVNQASKLTAQQSSVAPTGFTNSLLVTSSSAYTVVASDVLSLYQLIEGFNVADLGWGTASAQTITLSFWVRSSVTGSFGGSLQNSAANRSYPFTFTINASNTWEQKTVTVPGDTTGTWLTNNGLGLSLIFGLGIGSTFRGTSGAWAAGNFYAPTGATNIVSTNGATLNITGVQLEVGSAATPFERRQYGQELMLCQRYYCRTAATARFPATGSQSFEISIFWPVNMRVAPTVSTSGGLQSNTSITFPPSAESPTVYGARFSLVSAAAGDCYSLNRDIFASAEL